MKYKIITIILLSLSSTVSAESYTDFKVVSQGHGIIISAGAVERAIMSGFEISGLIDSDRNGSGMVYKLQSISGKYETTTISSGYKQVHTDIQIGWRQKW